MGAALALALVLGGPGLVPAAAAPEPAAEVEPILAGSPLADALAELQRRGLKLVFSSDLVRPGMRVAAEPRASSPRAILDELLAPLGLAAEDGPEGYVVVVAAPPPPSAAGAGSVTGTVRAREGAPVAGARVELPATGQEALTDDAGRFRLGPVATGSYELEVTAPGYTPQRVAPFVVEAGRTVTLAVELAKVLVALDQIVVTPSRLTIGEATPESRLFLTRERAARAPQLGDDLLRLVARLPGVAGSDRSALFSLRGGEPGESLVVLDGLEIYQPYHHRQVLGAFSLIDSETIGVTELLSGGLPVEYGDSISGVLELESVRPAAGIETAVGVGNVNLRLAGQGAFAAARGQWLVSARRWYPDTYSDLVLASGEDLDPTYQDLLARLSYRLSDRLAIAADLLESRDDLRFVSTESAARVASQAESRHAWLGLDIDWTPRLATRATFALGGIDSNRDGGPADPEAPVVQVADDRSFSFLGLKQDWTLELSERHFVKWGTASRRLRTRYHYASARRDEAGGTVDGELAPVSLAAGGAAHTAYVADRLRLSGRWTAELGLRWDRQTYTADPQRQLSPRCHLAFAQDARTTWRVAWGRYYRAQGIYELQVEDGESRFYPAEAANELTLGMERVYGAGASLRVEAYGKRIPDPRPRYENLFGGLELFPEAVADRVRVAAERGRAWGLELLLSGAEGRRFAWWGSYTLASAEDRVEGRWVPRSWDQRHSLDLDVGLRPGGGWSLDLAVVLHSGWPTTGLAAALPPRPDGTLGVELVPGPRNGERLPPYGRLDLRVRRTLSVGRGSLEVLLDVVNLLDRNNPCCPDGADLLPRPDGGVTVVQRREEWLRRTPSLRLTWRR